MPNTPADTVVEKDPDKGIARIGATTLDSWITERHIHCGFAYLLDR